MIGAVGKAFIFLVVLLGAFMWIGQTITAMTGGGKRAAAVIDVSPEGGEAIFWGKGRCYTCHSVGGRGSAVRCPNLGVFGEKFAIPIGARAAERAQLRSAETGLDYTATDYLVESLAKPDAFLVEGFKNEMAIVYAPPISLNLTEIKAVITYLQSQGGEIDIEALENPSEITATYFARIAAASAAGGGDPGNGEIVYEDNCIDCHVLKGEGEEIGPDLSAIAEKGLKFIADSITSPAKEISEGYETYIVVNLEGRKFTGLKSRDEADEIDITLANGDVVTLAKSDIKEIVTDDTVSIMPADLIEELTVKDYQDVLSFLVMQKGEEEDQ